MKTLPYAVWSCRSLHVFSRHLRMKVRCNRRAIRCVARCLVAPHKRKVHKGGRIAEFSVHGNADNSLVRGFCNGKNMGYGSLIYMYRPRYRARLAFNPDLCKNLHDLSNHGTVVWKHKYQLEHHAVLRQISYAVVINRSQGG